VTSEQPWWRDPLGQPAWLKRWKGPQWSPKAAYRITVVSVVSSFLFVLMHVALLAEDISKDRGWFLPTARVAQMLIFGSFGVLSGRRALRMRKDR